MLPVTGGGIGNGDGGRSGIGAGSLNDNGSPKLSIAVQDLNNFKLDIYNSKAVLKDKQDEIIRTVLLGEGKQFRKCVNGISRFDPKFSASWERGIVSINKHCSLCQM